MNKHYHLIGIGGIGMSAIAQILLRRGFKVSGSDLKESKATMGLARAGAQIFIGHKSANVTDAQVVVYSSAIKEDNPEISQARKEGLPLLKRAEALARLMQGKSVIAVAGSHGKTTTTSLVSCLLLEAGLFPTVAAGGIIKNIDNNACFGRGEFFVAEADESDGSFLHYLPKYSIITNIDREHLDYYREFKNEVEAFRKFIAGTNKDGCVFYCSDDANLKNIMAGYKNRAVSFGLDAAAQIHPEHIVLQGLSCEFDCYRGDKFIERFTLSLGGRHNICNSLAVIALGLELGIDLGLIKNALKGYRGCRRRLEVKFSSMGISVVDDYAHHPTEIKATILAAKNLPHQRAIGVFQPHRYSRTRMLFGEFCESFDSLDCLIITDIYPAGELPEEGVDAQQLCRQIKKRKKSAPGEVYFVPREELAGYVSAFKREGDLILTLGAGDITKVCDELVERIKRQGKS
ncbi:MAG: UDP-N-acetylmuramate--L-alanine ligase [Candidatus Omnitrophota bacterium]